MPSDKRKEQLEQELAAEREQLGASIETLRAEVDSLKRKLPAIIGAAVATAIVLGVVKRRLLG
jgi:hypothetical protein